MSELKLDIVHFNSEKDHFPDLVDDQSLYAVCYYCSGNKDYTSWAYDMWVPDDDYAFTRDAGQYITEDVIKCFVKMNDLEKLLDGMPLPLPPEESK